jgi:hypothetical protein
VVEESFGGRRRGFKIEQKRKEEKRIKREKCQNGI